MSWSRQCENGCVPPTRSSIRRVRRVPPICCANRAHARASPPSWRRSRARSARPAPGTSPDANGAVRSLRPSTVTEPVPVANRSTNVATTRAGSSGGRGPASRSSWLMTCAPASLTHRPTSHPAAVRARRARPAYRAPLAPVTPRKTRITPPMVAASPLRGRGRSDRGRRHRSGGREPYLYLVPEAAEEGPDLLVLLRGEGGEVGHHVPRRVLEEPLVVRGWVRLGALAAQVRAGSGRADARDRMAARTALCQEDRGARLGGGVQAAQGQAALATDPSPLGASAPELVS